MGKRKRRGSIFIAICFVLLIIPLLGTFDNVRHLLISVIPISDFWFGYMGYFGTVVLATVAVWQTNRANIQANKANELSEKLLIIELKSKMGYFNPRGIAQYKGHCWEEITLHNVGDDLAKINRIQFRIRDASGNGRYKTELLDHTKYTVFIGEKAYIPIPQEHKIEGDIDSRQVFMIVYLENSRSYQYKQVIDMIWNRDKEAVHSSIKIMELDEKLI